MKLAAYLALIASIIGFPTEAAAFLMAGDNAELFVTGAATVQRDDNIFLNASNARSDTIYSLTPGVDLVFGKSSTTSGNVYFREEIRRYSTNTGQNTNLDNAGASTSYSDGVTKANFNASYAEVAQNDNIVRAAGVIVRRKLTNLAGDGEVSISEKTRIAAGLTYAKIHYTTAGYVSNQITAIPVDFYYAANPKLDWSLGYQYRTSKLDATGQDSKDNFFNLGARGEFTPKLTGQVRFGYTQRTFDAAGPGRQNLFGVGSNLTYLYSENTSFQLNVSNDFGVSGVGGSIKQFVVGLTASNHFAEQWFVNAGLTSNRIGYDPTRTDTFLQGQASITYVYNKTLNFGASYTLRHNSSDLASAKFSNNVFSLGANLRY